MEKKELAQLLNEQFDLSVDWTKLTKSELEMIASKFQTLVPKETISADNIDKYVDDPVDFALEILQKKGGQLLAAKVEDVIEFVREEGIGKGKILQELSKRLGKGKLKDIIEQKLSSPP